MAPRHGRPLLFENRMADGSRSDMATHSSAPFWPHGGDADRNWGALLSNVCICALASAHGGVTSPCSVQLVVSTATDSVLVAPPEVCIQNRNYFGRCCWLRCRMWTRAGGPTTCERAGVSTAPILLYAALCERPYDCGITSAVFDRRLHSGPRLSPRCSKPPRRLPPPAQLVAPTEKVGWLYKRGGAGGSKLAKSSHLAASPQEARRRSHWRSSLPGAL